MLESAGNKHVELGATRPSDQHDGKAHGKKTAQDQERAKRHTDPNSTNYRYDYSQSGGWKVSRHGVSRGIHRGTCCLIPSVLLAKPLFQTGLFDQWDVDRIGRRNTAAK